MQALSPLGFPALSASPHYPNPGLYGQGMWPMLQPLSVYSGGHAMMAPMQPGPARAASPLRHVSPMRQSSPVRPRNAKAGITLAPDPKNGSRKSAAHSNTGVKAFGVTPLPARATRQTVVPTKKDERNFADSWAHAWHDQNSNPLKAVRPRWSAGDANLWDHAWHHTNSSPYKADRPRWE